MLNHHNDVFRRFSESTPKYGTTAQRSARWIKGGRCLLTSRLLLLLWLSSSSSSRIEMVLICRAQSVLKPRASSDDRHAFINRLIYVHAENVHFYCSAVRNVHQQAGCEYISTKCSSVNCDVKSILKMHDKQYIMPACVVIMESGNVWLFLNWVMCNYGMYGKLKTTHNSGGIWHKMLVWEISIFVWVYFCIFFS